MDDHGQIGPEKGDYAADVAVLASLLTSRVGGSVYFDLADRHGKLRVVATLVSALPTLSQALGQDGGEPEGLEGSLNEWLLVSVVEHGAYWFRLGQYQHASYIADKLDVTRGDGEIIGEFLVRLTAAMELKEVA